MVTRRFYSSLLILAVLSLVCTQIPLLNYLGFEFSVCIVLVAGYVAGLSTLVYFNSADCRNRFDVWRAIGRNILDGFVFILLPFLISLMNALFVKNCSLGDGLILYVLTVIPGMIFSVSTAVLIHMLIKRWRKTVFTIVYGLILIHIPLVTMLKPQVFTFNPLLGFFPGFTYDETLHVTQRLLTYRFTVLAASLSLFSGAVWIWHTHQRKKNQQEKAAPLAEMIILALFVPAVLVVYSFSDRLGLSSSEQFIRQKLAGNYKTRHFEIIYPAGSVKRERIEEIGRLHEYFYSVLKRDLRLQGEQYTTSFLYSSAEQKERLLGAGRTEFAKPWLHQIHINISEVEISLKHEMIHVLASEFGWSPLRISHNSGLIEGLAVALDGSSYSEPLDRAAALIFAAGIQPRMESLFSLSGFALGYSGVNYTLAGAFSQWLIDSAGIEKYKQLYTDGNFETVYGCTLQELSNRWKILTGKIPLQKEDTLKALYYFRRASIFGKECARVIANINQETRQLLLRHEFEQALASSERSLALSRSAEAIQQKSAALFELHRFETLREFLQVQLHDTVHGNSLLPLRLRLGDASWALDSIARADECYSFVAKLHLGEWYDEQCALRLDGIKGGQESNDLRTLLLSSMEDTMRIRRLEQLHSPVAGYMLAKEYYSKERYREGLQALSRVPLVHAAPWEYFHLTLKGNILMKLREYEEAESVFKQSVIKAPTPYSVMKARELIDRCVERKKEFYGM
jgi:hypothetical protein